MSGLIRLFVFDRATGDVHQVGTDPHDALDVTQNGVEYHNLQNSCGTMPNGTGEYVFMRSRCGDLCGWCRYDTGGFVAHPHCGGCDGANKFEIKPQIKEHLMNGKTF